MKHNKFLVCVLMSIIMAFNSVVFVSGETICFFDLKTSGEDTGDTERLLDDDVVFMTSNGKFFAHSNKSDYSSYGRQSFLSEDDVMVDVNVLQYALDVVFSIDGEEVYLNNKVIKSVIESGAVFASASDVGDALSMYIYKGDNRGFVLLSDTDRGYTNSPYSHDNQEPIDIIWRYMQFERPDGDELLESLKSGGKYQVHPRLWVNSDAISGIGERILQNKQLLQSKKTLFSKCDKYLVTEPIVPKLDGVRLFASCYSVKERLIDLCTAYMLADDKDIKEKYAKRAWEELDSVCNWDNWNLSNHFLDSGELGPGIAYAYDVLYNYLDETQKKSVRDRVNNLYLEYCEGMYTTPRQSGYDPMSYKNVQCNWGAVCSVSMLMLSLTFIDEEEETSYLTSRCKFIASNAMQTLEHIFTACSPEGTWDEGLGYWEFVMQHLGWGILCLDNIFKSDFGFLSVPGIDKLADYGIYNQTENGSFNKASTTSQANAFAPEMFIFAKLFNNAGKMEFYNEFYNKVDKNAFTAQYLLFYDPLIQSADEISFPPLDKYYSSNGNTILKGSWNNPYASYVGISGGKTSEHNDTHYDKGSFIFEALGERWSIDMGRNGNDTMAYLKRTESHSALTVNPVSDYPGQELNAHTYAEVFQSKPKGAMAVYDLTNAYSKYTSCYKRGFLLTNERNTLTIRDEIDLDETSELNWNMVTRADIKISDDGKSAVLCQNGKKLSVTATCNEDNWTFKEISDLAPAGGWQHDGMFTADQQQTFSSGCKKLVLSCNAQGYTTITVTLAPMIEEDFYIPSDVSLPDWSIPDGDLKNTIIFKNVKSGDVINSSVSKIVEFYLGGDFECINAYIDGKLADSIIKRSPDCKYSIIIPQSLLNCAGDVCLDIRAKFPSYTKSKTVNLNVCKQYSRNEKAYIDFSAYPDGEQTVEQVRKSLGLRYINLKDGYGIISKDELGGSKCMKFGLVKSKDVNGGSLAYIQLDKEIADGDIVHLSFDAFASHTNLKLCLALKKSYVIFDVDGSFFGEGKIYYEIGKAYHIDYISDLVNEKYIITVLDTEGNAVAQKTSYYSDDGYNGEFRLSFGVSSGDYSYFLIDNMKIETENYLQVSSTQYIENDRFYFNNIISASGVDTSDLISYVALYDEDGCMIDVKSYEYNQKMYVDDVYKLADNVDNVRVYFWDKSLLPCSKPVILKN